MFCEVFSHKTRRTNNNTGDSSVSSRIVTCEVRLQLIDNHVEEFGLARGMFVESSIIFGD